MKPKINFFGICILMICFAQGRLLISQNITNTIGTNGVFKIKSESGDYLSLSQNTGDLTLYKNLNILNTNNSTTGVIYKNGLRFIHNYKPPAALDGQNIFVGINSGNFTMGGDQEYYGVENTGVGNSALSSLTSGSQNSALGVSCLRFNTSGSNNTAIGSFTLYSNTSGYQNTALGSSSLYFNTTGNSNSGFGISSLFRNTTGIENSAFGSSSLYSNSTGTQNTAVGSNSLRYNVSGWNNTAVGHHSLLNNTGNYNTAVGHNSGSTITTGANLTCIGIDANPSSPTALDQVTLGNQFVTSLRCNVQTITSLSDMRDKKNIKELSLGLDFITKLHPRQFNWDKREWYDDNISDGSKMKEEPSAGFIAQELDSAQTKAGAQWLNLVLKDNPDKWEATYGNLLPVMVKAIQELKTENDELKEKLAKFEEMQSVMACEIEKMKSNSNTAQDVILSKK